MDSSGHLEVDTRADQCLEAVLMNSQQAFQDLMERVRAGRPEAIRELFDTYAQPLIKVIRRRLHQPLRTRFDSQDFIQEVWKAFFAAEMQQRHFGTPEELRVFLAQIARRKVVTEYRRHAMRIKRRVDRAGSLDDSQAVDNGQLAAPIATPSQYVMAEEQWDQLIQKQPPAYQQILALLRQGFTHEEIGRRLGVNPKTIQRLLRRIDPRLAS